MGPSRLEEAWPPAGPCPPAAGPPAHPRLLNGRNHLVGEGRQRLRRELRVRPHRHHGTHGHCKQREGERVGGLTAAGRKPEPPAAKRGRRRLDCTRRQRCLQQTPQPKRAPARSCCRAAGRSAATARKAAPLRAGCSACGRWPAGSREHIGCQSGAGAAMRGTSEGCPQRCPPLGSAQGRRGEAGSALSPIPVSLCISAPHPVPPQCRREQRRWPFCFFPLVLAAGCHNYTKRCHEHRCAVQSARLMGLSCSCWPRCRRW